MTQKERYQTVLAHFRQTQPHVGSELAFGNAFQLLVAVMLSAQCTDKRINQVTPALFARFPDAKSMAAAETAEIFDYIRSVSYPNAKAAHLSEMSRRLHNDFGGEVPSDRELLMSLPGVGRKTANVVRAVWFGLPSLAVDTHVYRVSHRLGLVSASANTPLLVEQELLRHIPEVDVNNAHHWLLLHGRYVCTSRSPHCDKCPFDVFCPKRKS